MDIGVGHAPVTGWRRTAVVWGSRPGLTFPAAGASRTIGRRSVIPHRWSNTGYGADGFPRPLVPRAHVYRALLDARAVATWMVPTGMTSHVHVVDAREGGSFRISLTYDEPTGAGKTTAHTDTDHGHFVTLVPNEQVVEVMAFETADAALRGEMTVTFTLTEAGGGTDVLAVHDNLPPGLSPADNATGWRMALDKLAAFVEAGQNT
jgi:uncharacterized protein YndB with AHSA1/START domain